MPEIKDAKDINAQKAMSDMGFGFENNLRAPGIARIPICTIKEATEASKYPSCGIRISIAW